MEPNGAGTLISVHYESKLSNDAYCLVLFSPLWRVSCCYYELHRHVSLNGLPDECCCGAPDGRHLEVQWNRRDRTAGSQEREPMRPPAIN